MPSINVQLRLRDHELALARDLMTQEFQVYPRYTPSGKESHADLVKLVVQLALRQNNYHPQKTTPSPESLEAIRPEAPSCPQPLDEFERRIQRAKPSEEDS